ncbi:MAG TPA: hypothetical protein VF062_09380 [Candidatus Limnocylindrales bacterium]
MWTRSVSEPAPDHPDNEDRVLVKGDLVGVFDGVTQPTSIESGCLHSVAWYVDRLTTRLSEAAGRDPLAPLADLLAAAIAATNGDHGGACDLTNPATLAATVCLVRRSGPRLEYLILCDAFLVVDNGRDIAVLTDTRFEQAVAGIRRDYLDGTTLLGTPEHAQRFVDSERRKYLLTNSDAGYWIAAANPAAARHAVTGVLPLTGPNALRRAALLTDGATRAVDTFAIMDWRELLDLATTEGPEALIKRIRDAENGDLTGIARPRFKRYDDATIALCEFAGDDDYLSPTQSSAQKASR